jgi:hypothetical protein
LGLTFENKGVFPFRMGEDGEKVMGGDITGCFFSTETKKNGFAMFENGFDVLFGFCEKNRA